MKQYADRDIMELDKAGGYYCRHISAMTGEGLHSKGDIAAELAHRDCEIDRLRKLLQQVLADAQAQDALLEWWHALECEMVPNA